MCIHIIIDGATFQGAAELAERIGAENVALEPNSNPLWAACCCSVDPVETARRIDRVAHQTNFGFDFELRLPEQPCNSSHVQAK